jgi:dihydrofolate synthase/folylpolyglutamate synthase
VRAGDLALAGHHQRTNAALACALLEASGLAVEPRHAEQGLVTATWPGRLERFGKVWLDGAHNPHAAAALARTARQLFAHQLLSLVFGALQDKDAGAMLRELGPLAKRVHYCAPDSPRAIAPERLAQLWPGEVHRTAGDALRAAQREAGERGVVLCCGSLYLAGELRALLLRKDRSSMPTERM